MSLLLPPKRVERRHHHHISSQQSSLITYKKSPKNWTDIYVYLLQQHRPWRTLFLLLLPNKIMGFSSSCKATCCASSSGTGKRKKTATKTKDDEERKKQFMGKVNHEMSKEHVITDHHQDAPLDRRELPESFLGELPKYVISHITRRYRKKMGCAYINIKSTWLLISTNLAVYASPPF